MFVAQFGAFTAKLLSPANCDPLVEKGLGRRSRACKTESLRSRLGASPLFNGACFVRHDWWEERIILSGMITGRYAQKNQKKEDGGGY